VYLNSKMKILAAAAFVALTPAAGFAQNASDDETTVTNTYDADTDTRRTTVTREDDDSDFPWGLLGLLGLAGLLGHKRRDADIHVDARKNTRP